jgi:hypothetical protein
MKMGNLQITAALANSAALVVACSPAAASAPTAALAD